MNGFFLIAEISELPQFINVDEAAASELIRNCERSVNNSFRCGLYQQGSFLIFRIESDIENSAAVVETATGLLSILHSYNEDIHEFSMMLVFRKNTDSQGLAAELKQSYFSICEDGVLLIERRIAEAAGLPYAEPADEGYYSISLDDEDVSHQNLQSLEHIIDSREVDKLIKQIIPLIDVEADQRLIVLNGSSEFVVRQNLSQAVQEASGKNRSINSAVYIDILEAESSVIMPFVRSVDMQLVPLVDDCLEGVELKTWLACKPRLYSVNSDFSEDYFFSVYCLYLKGVMKYFRNALLPAVIVFTGLSQQAEGVFRYAKRVIDYIDEETSPTVFFINCGGDGDNTGDLLPGGVFRYYSSRNCCASAEVPGGASSLNYHLTKLLYIIGITEGILDRRMLDSFLIDCGYNETEIVSGINSLENKGCIIVNRFIRVIRDDAFGDIQKKIGAKDEIYRKLAAFINAHMHEDTLHDFGLAAGRLASYAADPVVGSAVYNCLTILLDFSKVNDVKNCLAACEKLSRKLSDALKLRCYLLQNDRNSCMKMLKGLPDRPDYPENLEEAILMLETSQYFHAVRDYQRSMDYVKKVLIFLQAGDYPILEGSAFIDLGFLMLCKGKLLESAEYLSLAVEKLSGTKDYFNKIRAWLFTSIQQYLWGSLDGALDSAQKAVELSSAHGFEEWQFFSEFMICRLYFELGRYDDAEKKLAESLLRCEIYRDDERRRLFSAWTARACIYQGKIYRGINMLLSLDEDPEVLYFLTEAYYFNGNIEKALESIEKAESSEEYFMPGFLPLSHVSWKNGFNSIEDRALQSNRGTGVLNHCIRATHAYLLGMTGNREYGIEILFSLTRDEKISEFDPFNKLYFYFYCQMVEQRQNAELIDKLTLISKALKYLQQTSSRINDPKIRQQFMNKSYWNSKLVSEAQNEKLI